MTSEDRSLSLEQALEEWAEGMCLVSNGGCHANHPEGQCKVCEARLRLGLPQDADGTVRQAARTPMLVDNAIERAATAWDAGLMTGANRSDVSALQRVLDRKVLTRSNLVLARMNPVAQTVGNHVACMSCDVFEEKQITEHAGDCEWKLNRSAVKAVLGQEWFDKGAPLP